MNTTHRHTILTFHKIQSHFSYSVNNYTPKRFFTLIEKLLENDWEFIGYDNLAADPEKRMLLLTFDDGYKHLRPILKTLIERYQIRAHVFMPTGWIGKDNSWDYTNLVQTLPHLDESDITELSSIGITFGSHGMSHSDLCRLPSDRLYSEMRQSKELLEKLTGRLVNSISYPFGRYNFEVLQAATDTGYKYGFSMNLPGVNEKELELGRYPIYGFETISSIYTKLGRVNHALSTKIITRGIGCLSGGTTVLQRLRGK